MNKLVILGGAGGVGSVAARALAHGKYFDEIVLADVQADAARATAASFGVPSVTGVGVDASSPESLAGVMRGARVVLNCVGPFYRFGPPILAAAIAAKVDFVDVCDDLEPTQKMLDLDADAAKAGISALIGMGNSPGLANVFVRLCADQLLESIESVDIFHLHGGEPVEGAGVVKHRIHAMTNDIPLFLDGKFVNVRQLEASGQAVVAQTEFRGIGTFPTYPYPHPETITLPKYLPGLKRATNMGVIFPLSYFHLTQDMVRVGACTTTPIDVGGQSVIPLEFSVAHILSRRAALLAEAGITGPGGCLKVVVAGTKRGEPRTYVFSLFSKTAGAGEGTGIPAAVGAVLMSRGKITRKGVFAPEGGVDPLDVLPLAMEIAGRMGAAGGDSIHVESIDAHGVSTQVPLSF